MNKLASMVLMGGTFALIASGCVISSDDDAGQFDVTFSLIEGGPTPCINVGKLVLNVGIDANDTTPLKATFDGSGCLDSNPSFVLDSDVIDYGNYTVWVDILTAGDVMVAQSNFADVALNDVVVDVALGGVPLDNGRFGLDWTIAGSTDLTTGCASIGATGVSVSGTHKDDNDMLYDSEFACSDGTGATANWPIGNYSISVAFVDNTGAAVLTFDSMDDQTIDWGNQTKDLGVYDSAAAN